MAAVLSTKSEAPRRTRAQEDYLEQILSLIEKKGYARVVDIAKNLNIAQASVTGMIQRMDAEGLVSYEKYRGVILTPGGEKIARAIINRHESLSKFFKLFDLYDDTLGLYNDPAYPRLPDIEANRDDFNIVAFPVEPGDVVIFHPSVLHGGGPTREHDVRQTLSLRFFGDDAVVAARPGADIPNKSTHPLSQVGRRSDGSPFRHEGFPKIY